MKALSALAALAIVAGISACDSPKNDDVVVNVPPANETANDVDECPRADGQPCR